MFYSPSTVKLLLSLHQCKSHNCSDTRLSLGWNSPRVALYLQFVKVCCIVWRKKKKKKQTIKKKGSGCLQWAACVVERHIAVLSIAWTGRSPTAEQNFLMMRLLLLLGELQTRFSEFLVKDLIFSFCFWTLFCFVMANRLVLYSVRDT